MQKEEVEVRNSMIVVRMNKAELELFQKLQQKTTDKNRSNYLRKIALQEPVIVKYRNASADDFAKALIPLIKELNAIGKNYNQEVRKLNMLLKIPEFRNWILENERLKQSFVNKTEQIKSQVAQIYEQWCRK